MKVFIVIFSCLFAWDGFALSEDDARHILSRSGERINETNIRSLKSLNRKEAFNWLLRNHELEKTKSISISWNSAYEEFYNAFIKFHDQRQSKSYLRDLIKKVKSLKSQAVNEGFGDKEIIFNLEDVESLEINSEKLIDAVGHILNMLWLRKIAQTSSPFTENLTLFWHGHFTSAFTKVKQPDLMLKQNAMLREMSLGNFRDLLYAVTLDGAMLSYLDGKDNVKGKPNENYARELLELFTLGEGNYTENDIREIARALTGIKHDLKDNIPDPSLHDSGTKIIFGKKGNYTFKDVLEILLADERTSILITKKLWTHYVSPEPDMKIVKKWAKNFRKSRYNIRELMESIFVSDQFYAKKNRLSLIKSPVEFTMSYFYHLDLQPKNYIKLAHHTRLLGQALFEPPDVRGWLGGTKWITPSTWLIRQKYVHTLFSSGTKKIMMDEFNLPDNGVSEAELQNWKLKLSSPNWQPQAAFYLTAERKENKKQDPREFFKELMSSPRFSLK